MGEDRSQPESSSWPPRGGQPPPGEGRAPDREWYPGTGWYPGKEYRPPQYGQPRYPGAPYPPGHYPPANGRPVNGHGANGHGVNGDRVNGHQRNGDQSPRQDDYLEDWFREKPERRRPRDSEHPAQGREYSSREQEYQPPRDLYPGSGGHSILGLNPPPGRRPPRRHRVRNGMLVGLGCLIVIVGVGTGLTGGKLPSSSSGSRAAASTAGAAAPPAARPKAKGTTHSGSGPTLSYRVTGAPGAAVTYGPAGGTSTRQGPLRVTTTLGSALYYSITAQPSGSGAVTCEILIGSRVISKSGASGAGNLASCEISQDPLSGKWQDADRG